MQLTSWRIETYIDQRPSGMMLYYINSRLWLKSIESYPTIITGVCLCINMWPLSSTHVHIYLIDCKHAPRWFDNIDIQGHVWNLLCQGISLLPNILVSKTLTQWIIYFARESDVWCSSHHYHTIYICTYDSRPWLYRSFPVTVNSKFIGVHEFTNYQ